MSTVKELRQSAIDAIEGLYSGCERDVEKLENKIANLETEMTELQDTIRLMHSEPEWGGCRRGCPESYLDAKGFCSPACAMGAPKVNYLTTVETVQR